MNKNKFVSVSSFIFLAIGVVHSLRLLYGWEVQIGELMVPEWVAWVAIVLTFYLAFFGFKLSKRG